MHKPNVAILAYPYKIVSLGLISSKSIFSLDLSTLQLTRISNHGLVTVTGAAVDQNGELLIPRFPRRAGRSA